MKGRLLSILLAAVMLLSVVPLGVVETAWAADNSGSCGENVTWSLSDDGTLTISGTGPMADYEDSHSPWVSCGDYIKSIVIESGVTSIGNSAFYGCKNLASVMIPNSVKTIGDETFCGCKALASVTIPDSVIKIGSSVFEDCTALTSATLSKGMTSFGSRTFLGCTALKSVTLPGGITTISSSTFSSCTSLTSVTIPNGVTEIDSYAFSNCTALTAMTIPDSVTEISVDAFIGCTGLTSINIPNGVTSLGSRAFENCTALTDIKLPSWLEFIDYGTFSNCVRLASVTIPKSVTSIDKNAFYYCESLTDVYYTGTEADWAKIVIAEGNEDLTNAKLHAATIFTPANVELVGATPAAGSIVVTWQAAEGASAYTIYRKPAGTNSWAIIARNVSGTSYTDKSVTAGESYTYTVRGVAADGRTMSKGYDTKGVTAKVFAVAASSVTG